MDTGNVLTSWDDANCHCDGTWQGVTCANSLNTVTAINISSLALVGALPDSWSALTSLTSL